MKRFKLSHLRLKTDRCFKEVLEKGKKVYFRYGVMYILETINTNIRFAVIVPSSSGKSVKRNRIKRLVREYFRLNQYNLKASDIIVKMSRNISDIKGYKDVKKIFDELFIKEGLFLHN